jgi:hypothetical protein
MTTSYKISDRLFLIKESIKTNTAIASTTTTATNYIAVVDVSGSMYGAIDRIRDDIKKKLPKLIGDKDTFSLIWFSGRDQFGVILEGEPIATLPDLNRVNGAIDRWLRCVGMTGFKQPLEEVAALAGRVAKKSPGAFSLFFMSDGCDNQWPRDEVLKAVEKAGAAVTAATFVEYGYYADRPLLTQMAERAGGTLIHSQDFDRFEAVFSESMGRKAASKKVSVKLPNVDVVGGFAFGLADKEIPTFAVEKGAVTVPDGMDAVFFLSPTSIGEDGGELQKISQSLNSTAPIAATYAAVSLFSTRMKPEIVKPLLKVTGDVALIDQFNACFGKQKYSEFMDATKVAAFDTSKRLAKGWDPSKVPPDDAFTVLDTLKLLASDEGNKLLLDHESFKYSRIGRGRLDSAENFTVAEKDEVLALAPNLNLTFDDGGTFINAITDNTVKSAVKAKFDEIKATKVEALKFVADESPEGYPVSNLTYNEERANVSVLVKKTGSIDISKRVPSEHKKKLPNTIPSFIYRNYAIIKDGLVNVDVLPVTITKATWDKIQEEQKAGRLPLDVITDTGKGIGLVQLTKLPIINAKMVKAVSAKKLFEDEYALTKARAAQKVYKGVLKEKFPDAKKSEGFSVLYGEDAASWLKDQGITDYNGFNPKSTVAPSVDVYNAKKLEIGLKGLSSLPTLKDVREKMAKGKLTASAALMAPAVKEIDDFLASDIYKKAKKQDDVFQAWLEAQAEGQTKITRGLIFDMTQTKFSIIVGQVWPSEFKSIDENSLTINVDGNAIEATLKASEVEEKI